MSLFDGTTLQMYGMFNVFDLSFYAMVSRLRFTKTSEPFRLLVGFEIVLINQYKCFLCDERNVIVVVDTINFPICSPNKNLFRCFHIYG